MTFRSRLYLTRHVTIFTLNLIIAEKMFQYAVDFLSKRVLKIKKAKVSCISSINPLIYLQTRLLKNLRNEVFFSMQLSITWSARHFESDGSDIACSVYVIRSNSKVINFIIVDREYPVHLQFSANESFKISRTQGFHFHALVNHLYYNIPNPMVFDENQ